MNRSKFLPFSQFFFVKPGGTTEGEERLESFFLPRQPISSDFNGKIHLWTLNGLQTFQRSSLFGTTTVYCSIVVRKKRLSLASV